MAPRVILHLDMDAFFAAIEQRDHPELRGKPVIVGHRGERGVVATCSYEARRFGIRSAMPSVTAERLCPEALWVRSRFGVYSDVSARVFEIFERHVPVVERVSIDEAYGDLTGAVADLDEGAEVARRIKAEIARGERLTASAGVAPNRFLAKIASDMEKPDGLVVIPAERAVAVLGPLPVRVIPGVGPKSAEKLAALGVRTVSDLAGAREDRLERELGRSMAHYLAERAGGHDDSPITPWHERKQISEERTYRRDITGRAAVERELLARAEGIAAELRRRELLARVVAIKVRDGRYQTVTRSRTLDEPTDLASEIKEVAQFLLGRVDEFRERGIRLLGVAARDLIRAKDLTPPLFPDERRQRERAIARAADALRARFGEEAVRPARLLDDHEE